VTRFWRSPLVPAAALFIAVVLLVLITAWYSDRASTVGLIGVLTGAMISTVATIVTTRADRRFQLATTALDRRLAAHQEAYAIRQEIIRFVHQRDKIGEVVVKAQDWWTNNCLYLNASSRSAFRACFIAAANHRDLVEGPRSPETTKLVQENWATITKPGQNLVSGVALPPLDNSEMLPGSPGSEGR
jgi:hypothetical protein